MRFATDLQNATRFATQHFHYSTNILVQTITCSRLERSAPPLSISGSGGRNGLDRGLPPADRVRPAGCLACRLDRERHAPRPRRAALRMFDRTQPDRAVHAIFVTLPRGARGRLGRMAPAADHVALAKNCSGTRTACRRCFLLPDKKTRSRTARFARWQFNEYPVPASLPRATRLCGGNRRKSTQRCAASIAAPRARVHPAA